MINNQKVQNLTEITKEIELKDTEQIVKDMWIILYNRENDQAVTNTAITSLTKILKQYAFPQENILFDIDFAEHYDFKISVSKYGASIKEIISVTLHEREIWSNGRWWFAWMIADNF